MPNSRLKLDRRRTVVVDRTMQWRIILSVSVPMLAILSPLLTFLLSTYSEELFNGYRFGFELLIVNGAIMFAGLLLASRKRHSALTTRH